MSTTANDPVITSYAEAPARTITAGGVTYAYRELGPKGGIPVRASVAERSRRSRASCPNSFPPSTPTKYPKR